MPRADALRQSPLDESPAGRRPGAAPASRKRAETGLGVLGKATRLLDLLAATREATTAELADALDEPRSSVHRLVNVLAELDLIEPGSQRGRYRLGLKLLRLGSAVVSRLDVRLAALPLMERIHDDTGETVYLLLKRGRDAVCIERIDGRRAALMDLKLGGSLPLHEGAGPRAFLAFGPRSEWQHYIDGGSLYDSQTGTDLDPEDLIAELEKARRTGMVVNEDVYPPGFAAIGAPIMDFRGEVCAALSISGTHDSLVGPDRDRVSEEIAAAALEISRSLGYDQALQPNER
jgi:DNA-binding IclR family transcriptional regulator